VSPDGKRPYAVLQGPLVNEPGPNNGRDGRDDRIVVFDNNPKSKGKSIAQEVYQLELQADVAAPIVAAGGNATATDLRQGRNIGVSAIIAVNDHDFLVLERGNRGIGVDDPRANTTGSKRVFRIDITSGQARSPLTAVSSRPSATATWSCRSCRHPHPAAP
jgi:phytase-like protein